MALGDPYVTTAQLKTYLGISDTVDDTSIDDAVAAASRAIEKYCGRQFNKTTTASARVFYPRSCGVVTVDDFHTTTELVIKTDEGDDGTYEMTWDAADYQLEPLNGMVDGESGWPYWKVRAVEGRSFPLTGLRAPVQVTAQWGWNAVPAPVKQAAKVLAAETFKLAAAPFGVAGYGEFGPIRVRSNPMAAEMLNPYRHHTVLVG